MIAKIMIATVGTGVGPAAEERIRSLAHGIVTALKTHNPSYVHFVTSEEGKQTVEEIVRQLPSLEDHHEEHITDDINDIRAIMTLVEQVLEQIIGAGHAPEDIVVDYTSGTKAMSAGATLAALRKRVGILNYVGGGRTGGRVERGREEIFQLNPREWYFEDDLRQGFRFLERGHPAACLAWMANIDREHLPSHLAILVDIVRGLAKALHAWNLFDHEQATRALEDTIKQVKVTLEGNDPVRDMSERYGLLGLLPVLQGCYRFLRELLNTREKNQSHHERMLLADLRENAERQANAGHLDDAVARLYRVTEFLAQHLLRAEFHVESGDIPLLSPALENIPARLRERLEAQRQDGKVKIGLFLDYELLSALDHEAGRAFSGNRRLQDAIRTRNEGILAHGSRPVSPADWDKLRVEVDNLLGNYLPGLAGLRKRARHPSSFI